MSELLLTLIGQAAAIIAATAALVTARHTRRDMSDATGRPIGERVARIEAQIEALGSSLDRLEKMITRRWGR